MSLKETLEKIRRELARKDEVRQEIHTATRRASRLSKQAIFQIHRARLEKAEETLREAEKILRGIRDMTKDYPDLLYMGSIDSALQEYAEAKILLGLIREFRFVSFEELGVPMTSYVLGLADVIGELRRRALESLRRGKMKEAEECLEIMETIYEEIINLEEIQLLVSGLRRKCDTGRKIIEATRADITIESGRASLERRIADLRKALDERTGE
ncbi:MAG: RNA-binding protein [Candidatus Bathyarchaeota archaeon B63]|nr:MAG: RNA-binding protein [Candidatus Bathyarchaeota archaeon B63]